MNDKELSEVIVQAVLGAADSVLAHNGAWDAFEYGSCLTDLAGLSSGDDCHYDRPAIGVQYALWYHPQRTADLVRLLLPLIEDRVRSGRPLHLIDLGAGTGATVTAARVAAARAAATGSQVPPLRIEALESSPFMLDMFRAIDAQMQELLPGAEIDVTTHQRSWFSPKVSASTIALDEPHIVASYTFDHSDRELNSILARRLRQLADQVAADAVHILGPHPKRDILNGVVADLQQEREDSSRWDMWDAPTGRFDPTASLAGLADRRRQLAADHNPAAPLLRRVPSWENEWLWRSALRRAPTQLLPPSVLPFGFALDDVQDAAADPTHDGAPRPTAIVGAAGSGKSYVLMERAARILEADQQNRVLVTAFNIGMVDELAKILQARLPELDLACETETGGLWCDRRNGDSLYTSRVVFCNRDKLPTRIFDMQFDRSFRDVRAEVRAEAERFIWGKALFELDDYLAHHREGVGAGNRLVEAQRRRLWDAFWAEGKENFTHRRIATLQAVRRRDARANQRFTHVLVDESQDFTEADYELLRHLIYDPGGFTVAGDEAQSLHLGGTYKRPTLRREDGSATVWRPHRLEGAYRLPVAACRAVAPLARHVQEMISRAGSRAEDLTVPEPRKASSYGPRPIVVHEPDVATELPRILRYYERYSRAGAVCVTDGSTRLRSLVAVAARAAELRVDTENMRKIKGLERPTVVVLADAPTHEDEETAAQCFYTAMTRATTVNVTILPISPSPVLATALQQLDPQRFLPWNANSEAALRDVTRPQEPPSPPADPQQPPPPPGGGRPPKPTGSTPPKRPPPPASKMRKRASGRAPKERTTTRMCLYCKKPTPLVEIYQPGQGYIPTGNCKHCGKYQ